MAGLAPSGMLRELGVALLHCTLPGYRCLFAAILPYFLFCFVPLYRYRYDWKREEAEKYILRTHTTAVSARMLYEVANARLRRTFRVLAHVLHEMIYVHFVHRSNRVASSP